MKRQLLIALALLCTVAAKAQLVTIKNPQIIQGTLIRTTPPLKDIPDFPVIHGPNDRTEKLGGENPIPIKPHPVLNPDALPRGEDPALQKNYVSAKGQQTESLLNSSWAGLGYSSVNPSDNVVAAGPNHVVQMINNSTSSSIRIWDKAGNVLVASKLLSTITGVAGRGDPDILYDQLADRWILTEFGNGVNRLYICVSQTADPNGAYYVYQFNTPEFPDYPKYALWQNAYVITTNETNATIYAVDRNTMLTGAASTTIQRFTLTDFPTLTFQASSPVNLSGTTLPGAGTTAMFMRMADDGWGGNITTDRLELFNFTIDWATPANSNITGPFILPVLPFSSDLCGYTSFACVPQPSSTVKLDPLREVLMNKVQYRNFGTHESIVCSHVCDANGADKTGIRWYELRKSGTSGWTMYQQGTYSPDGDGRFMSTMSINGDGSIGMAYNVSSATTFPSIRYTGRKDCDPLGQMTEPEATLIAGTAANASNRYGDYNAMTVDPSNGSFWFTSNYNPATQWATRVGNFSITGCTSPCDSVRNLSASSITSNSLQLNWSPTGAGNYIVEYGLSGSGVWTNAGNTPATMMAITALSPSTLYDFRVTVLCASISVPSNIFTVATASASACAVPSGLNTITIAQNAATAAWSAVSGATSYTLQYKKTADPAFTTVVTNITGLYYDMTNLVANTSYTWQVKANCAGGGSAFSTSVVYTTLNPPACTDSFEPNNSNAAAVTITANSTILSRIGTSTDQDWYKFNNTTGQPNIKISLTNLPLNYNIRLYNPSNTLVATSALAGTFAEKIIFNTATVGTYRVQVYNGSGTSSTSCYTLNVTINGTPMMLEPDDLMTGIRAIPSPASNELHVLFNTTDNREAGIAIYDLAGRPVLQQTVSTSTGLNNILLDVRKIPNGMYILKVKREGRVDTEKVVITH
ncbi:MAG: fibronectin type III domain-containing protein [Bacteroidetes bacterium]|nr:fibronectin type III domain-containing protein [Bacteroidota bacterium]